MKTYIQKSEENKFKHTIQKVNYNKVFFLLIISNFYNFQRALHRQILFSKIMKKRRVKKSLIWKTETVLLKRKSYKCRGSRAKRRNWRSVSLLLIYVNSQFYPLIPARDTTKEAYYGNFRGNNSGRLALGLVFETKSDGLVLYLSVSLCSFLKIFFENIETNSFNGCDSLSIHRSSGSKLCWKYSSFCIAFLNKIWDGGCVYYFNSWLKSC